MNHPKPTPSGVVAAVADIAERMPDQVAVIDGDSCVTYGQLWSMVEEIAERLQESGVEPGHRIALAAEGSARYLATALGVWHARAVLVTVYPSSGASELDYAIRHSDPSLIIIDSAIDRSAVEASSPGAPVVDIDLHDLSSVRTDAPPNPTGLRAPLYMICFSSGTTATPKAVMLSEVTIHNTAATYAEVWHLSPDDRGVISLPLAWLYGLVSTTLALLVGGGTVVLLRRGHAAALHAAVRDHSATFIAGVPATFGKLVERMTAGDADPADFSSLRSCISGGEPRNEVLFTRWKELTGISVLDAYCASECIPLVTYDPRTDPDPRPGSAGKLVPRAQLKILDGDGSPVAPGEIGEAFSTGVGLMLGYWRDDELTRSVITDDGWYRTKDLVRVDEDGYVYVVGRLSDLIIRGGSNVSPSEVEHIVRRHPSVRDVVVVGMPDPLYGERIVAAVVPQRPGDLDADELQSFAKSQLSSYKVPGTFVEVADFPRNTTTGKINRKALVDALERQGV